MQTVFEYINELKHSEFSKERCLEFLETYIDLKIKDAIRTIGDNNTYRCCYNLDCDNCEHQCSIWKHGYETGIQHNHTEYEEANCGNCGHGIQITYCKRWKNAFNADNDACLEHEVKEDD